MKQTSFEEFKTLATQGTFVPVCKEILADLLTPVSAFLKVAEHSDYAFLLESVEGGEQVARYSFLGKDPFLVLRGRDGRSTVEQAGIVSECDQPFVEALRAVMTEYHSPIVAGLPRFTGGAVGYLGYDSVPWFEPKLAKSWADGPEADDGASDDAVFMLFDTVLAFDHVKHRILIIANARVASDEPLESLYQFACAKIRFLEGELERTLSRPGTPNVEPSVVTSNISQEGFEDAVLRAKRHISEGDIFQVVLSQRFQTQLNAGAFSVYRALRHVNPSPYMYFMRLGDTAIAGSSPEMLVRVEGDRVETHPIAGTRPRGGTEEEDESFANELENDEKERAEHVMLVDLGRNDIGKVCEYGTVRVSQFMQVERYSHVMHLCSKVEGKLSEDVDSLGALVACFPAGTVSGAPKLRAMEIIAKLEPTRRGIYAGAIGYLDFAGNLDCCIGIRTVTIHGSSAVVQAGAGIVADSDPASEYEETKAKARAMLRAIEIAEGAN